MPRFFRLTLALALLLWPAVTAAEQYPDHVNVWVNDYAGIIDAEAEARITEALRTLKAETGVEATVLTIETRAAYDGASSLETFATGLFNHWGIGAAATNTGILILVARADREMRIELGKGYARGYDIIAGDVIDNVFLPAFREDRYSAGIEAGTRATIDEIARPGAAGNDPPERSSGGGIDWQFWLIPAGFMALIAGIKLGPKAALRMRRCPVCGRRMLHRRHETLTAATRSSSGQGESTIWCSNCDYRDTKVYTISRISSSSSSGGSFGGGRSSGGGASGRW